MNIAIPALVATLAVKNRPFYWSRISDIEVPFDAGSPFINGSVQSAPRLAGPARRVPAASQHERLSLIKSGIFHAITLANTEYLL
jgi:hypothetical protein